MPAAKRLQTPIAIVALLVFLTGCAAMRSTEERPGVSLASIRVIDIKGLETTFEVDLRIINRGQDPLAIRGINLELALDGRQLAEGVANPRIDIDAYADAVVPVKVYSSMFDMIGIARRLMARTSDSADGEPLAYAISGHLQTGTSGWMGKVPFDTQGQIDLRKMAGGER